jgi:hypothetical protein
MKAVKIKIWKEIVMEYFKALFLVGLLEKQTGAWLR